MFSLFIKSAWRTSNVVASRYLGIAPKYLPTMIMFLTNRCNLRCRTCGVCDLERTRGDEEELTTAQWKAVIDSAAKQLGTSLAAVSGGEPLLRKDIFEIIRYATDSGIAIHLCTNAVLLDDVAIENLRASGVATVSISLESPDPSVHDYLRGDNTFPVVIAAIRRLRALAPNIRIGINYLITARNYKHMCDMVDFAESLGVHQIKFAPIHTNLLHRLKARERYGDLLFREEDLDDLEREVRRLTVRCKKSGLVTTSEDFLAGVSKFYKKPVAFRCYAGYAICAISPTGNVAPCCDKDSRFNVKERPLEAIWRNPEFHELRKQSHTCAVPWWDTTYTELSLMLRPGSIMRNLLHHIRNMRYYFGDVS